MIDPRARLLLIINVGLLAVTFERPLSLGLHRRQAEGDAELGQGRQGQGRGLRQRAQRLLGRAIPHDLAVHHHDRSGGVAKGEAKVVGGEEQRAGEGA